ncbi:MAG: hypothetical protein WC520_01060, partial [Candidatus Paceibacterota bacterium]
MPKNPELDPLSKRIEETEVSASGGDAVALEAATSEIDEAVDPRGLTPAEWTYAPLKQTSGVEGDISKDVITPEARNDSVNLESQDFQPDNKETIESIGQEVEEKIEIRDAQQGPSTWEVGEQIKDLELEKKYGPPEETNLGKIENSESGQDVLGVATTEELNESEEALKKTMEEILNEGIAETSIAENVYKVGIAKERRDKIEAERDNPDNGEVVIKKEYDLYEESGDAGKVNEESGKEYGDLFEELGDIVREPKKIELDEIDFRKGKGGEEYLDIDAKTGKVVHKVKKQESNKEHLDVDEKTGEIIHSNAEKSNELGKDQAPQNEDPIEVKLDLDNLGLPESHEEQPKNLSRAEIAEQQREQMELQKNKNLTRAEIAQKRLEEIMNDKNEMPYDFEEDAKKIRPDLKETEKDPSFLIPWIPEDAAKRKAPENKPANSPKTENSTTPDAEVAPTKPIKNKAETVRQPENEKMKAPETKETKGAKKETPKAEKKSDAKNVDERFEVLKRTKKELGRDKKDFGIEISKEAKKEIIDHWETRYDDLMEEAYRAWYEDNRDLLISEQEEKPEREQIVYPEDLDIESIERIINERGAEKEILEGKCGDDLWYLLRVNETLKIKKLSTEQAFLLTGFIKDSIEKISEEREFVDDYSAKARLAEQEDDLYDTGLEIASKTLHRDFRVEAEEAIPPIDINQYTSIDEIEKRHYEIIKNSGKLVYPNEEFLKEEFGWRIDEHKVGLLKKGKAVYDSAGKFVAKFIQSGKEKEAYEKFLEDSVNGEIRKLQEAVYGNQERIRTEKINDFIKEQFKEASDPRMALSNYS